MWSFHLSTTLTVCFLAVVFHSNSCLSVKPSTKKMKELQALEVLQHVGAILTDDHFVYTSGKHGSAYVNKDAIYPTPNLISGLCNEIAEVFRDDKVDVVIAPAIGGVILTQWTALHLRVTTGKSVLAVYAEKEADGTFVIKRGYDRLIKDKRVLVVEDILTTGGSARKVVDATRAIGGNIIGVGVICNRGGITAKDLGDVPKLFSLTYFKFDTWDEAKCPFCAAGVPINTNIGKGREFLARKATQG